MANEARASAFGWWTGVTHSCRSVTKDVTLDQHPLWVANFMATGASTSLHSLAISVSSLRPQQKECLHVLASRGVDWLWEM